MKLYAKYASSHWNEVYRRQESRRPDNSRILKCRNKKRMSVVNDLSFAMLTNYLNQFDDDNDVRREMRRKNIIMTVLTSKNIKNIHTTIKRYQFEAVWFLDRVVKEYIRSLLNDIYSSLYHDENNSVRMATIASRLSVITRHS